MLGLDRGLPEHQLPIKQGFQPYKQSVRNYSLQVRRMGCKHSSCRKEGNQQDKDMCRFTKSK
jgi:hypothetical protein